MVAPTSDDGDQQHAVFENGKVTVPESMKKKRISSSRKMAWVPAIKNHEDESALPNSILACINEYLIGANAALCPYFLATSGAAGLIQSFGSEEVKRIFLPKMFSGQWTGTMDLTEPGGGSDVGDILSKRYPTDQPGIYKIKGTKCFITGGGQDNY